MAQPGKFFGEDKRKGQNLFSFLFPLPVSIPWPNFGIHLGELDQGRKTKGRVKERPTLIALDAIWL